MRREPLKTMPTIAWLSSAKIQIFADDHMPPHFHLFRPRSNALVTIDDLRVIRGRADRRDLAEARAWSERHPGRLRERWRRLNERG
jgi:hypothetical protein